MKLSRRLEQLFLVSLLAVGSIAPGNVMGVMVGKPVSRKKTWREVASER